MDGAELGSPGSDTLPTSTGDARLVDQDLDGNPGITVRVDAGLVAGDIYLVQRSSYAYEGIVTDHDRVEAYVDFEQDQSILGASSSLLTMAEVDVITNPERTTSYVIFQQIDEGIDCDDIKRDTDSLF